MPNIAIHDPGQLFRIKDTEKNKIIFSGDLGSTAGLEDPLEKGTATHSSILAWRILWTTVHGVGCKELDTTEQFSLTYSSGIFFHKTMSNGAWTQNKISMIPFSEKDIPFIILLHFLKKEVSVWFSYAFISFPTLVYLPFTIREQIFSRQ